MKKSVDPTFNAFHAIVHGMVQGVGFRYWALNAATAAGLTGWVRNLDNGTVELLCEGPQSRLDQFAALLERGAPGSRVSRVELRPVVPRGTWEQFSIAV